MITTDSVNNENQPLPPPLPDSSMASQGGLQEADSFARLACPVCRASLAESSRTLFAESSAGESDPFRKEQCPACRADISVNALPAIHGHRSGRKRDENASEGNPVCHFFPNLRAATVCDECGVFLSHRANVRWSDRDLCLPCLHRLREESHDPSFVGRGRFYDRISLALVTYGAPISLFTAPVALFLLLRHSKDKASFVPHRSSTWWVALLLSILWLALWAVAITIWASLIHESLL